jgi:uncharacterized protein
MFLSSEAIPVRWRPRRRGFDLRAAVHWLLAATILLVSTLAQAGTWTPPPLRGHVVDQAGALTAEQSLYLDRKLESVRQQTGFAIVVFLLPKLPDGLSIEDVGYTAGNAWGVGSKGDDNGVLLIASLGDRKLRIETGKGVGGALTDIQSSHINRDVIGPLMKQGRTYDAMNQGVDAIVRELVDNTPGGQSEGGRTPSAAGRGRTVQAHPATMADYVKLGIVGLVILGVIILAIVSPTFREILFWMFLFGRGGGGGGGGGRNDDDDFGSGYGGGGGTFGGGGSSDDY